jgi:hypothetical protein
LGSEVVFNCVIRGKPGASELSSVSPLGENPNGRLEMNLKDLLLGKNIDPQSVLVLRHRPLEPELNKVLPWLAAERLDVFNAYQQTQTK